MDGQRVVLIGSGALLAVMCASFALAGLLHSSLLAAVGVACLSVLVAALYLFEWIDTSPRELALWAGGIVGAIALMAVISLLF